jgi:hypothetical protein
MVAVIVAPALLVCVTVRTAQATMIATEQVVEAGAHEAARARLHAFFQREDVRGVLVDWGVDAAEAQARVDAMTDAEVVDIAARIDDLPAGGSAVGAIVGAVVLIFLVLLITDLLGLTDVFPFVKKHR